MPSAVLLVQMIDHLMKEMEKRLMEKVSTHARTAGLAWLLAAAGAVLQVPRWLRENEQQEKDLVLQKKEKALQSKQQVLQQKDKTLQESEGRLHVELRDMRQQMVVERGHRKARSLIGKLLPEAK